MKIASSVLRAIANELAAKAKSQLPMLKEGETVIREDLNDGVFTRETSFGNLYRYDFRQKKSGGDDDGQVESFE